MLPESADVGMLGRFFGRLTGGNWRPPADELAFAAAAGFDTLQIRSDRPGELEDELGCSASELGDLFARRRRRAGPRDARASRRRARHARPRAAREPRRRSRRSASYACTSTRSARAEAAPLLRDDFAEALDVAEDAGLIFATEHNAAGHRLLVEPDEVEALLDGVPGLGLVWDINHTPTEHVPRFLALRELFTLVHVSDTPLPETNHHLPLGRGTVDFSVLEQIEDVPFILEIGGLPHSGGPGLDTNDALLDSLARLRA